MVSKTSGDLIADRRFAWGEAAARDNDHAAAADLFDQTIERVDDWPPVWVALGESRQKLGHLAEAAVAYIRAGVLDPGDKLGAGLRLASMNAGSSLSLAPSAYVRDLFDQYAARFDDHLVGVLGYRGPLALREAVDAACRLRARPTTFELMLDLGCGTGLAAKAFAGNVASIEGVDLSPAMIVEAGKTGCYAGLTIGDLVDFLEKRAVGMADLVVAADVLVYIGDIEPLLAGCFKAMARGGLLAFTAQLAMDGDWRVGADLRFAHSVAYLRRVALKAGFDVCVLDILSTRRNAGLDVPGLVAALARP